MNKKKCSLIIATTLLVNTVSPMRTVFASQIYEFNNLINEKNNIAIEEDNIDVSKFNLINNQNIEGYNEVFKVPVDNIKSITNNGGKYANSIINYAIDGELSTHWETGTPNREGFTNEVIVEFNDIETINRIVYATRQDGAKGKGFPLRFQVYTSLTENGDDFTLVGEGRHSIPNGDLMEFKFKEASGKRIKLVFNEAHQNWASASELWFYKEDKVSDSINDIFTDGTWSKVKDEYNKFEIDQLAEDIVGHPLESELFDSIRIAQEVIDNPNKYLSDVISLESRGNSIRESQKRKVWNFQDWQPTGYGVKSGDVINVYVDVEKGKQAPELVFKQMDSRHNGNISIKLNEGKNVITIPEVEALDLRPGTPLSGVLYTLNPYTEEEQGRMPKIRIEGADSYPYYIKGETTDEEVMKALEDYVKLLETNPQLPNVFEVFSDKALVNTTATYALNWYKQNGKSPSYTADKSDEVISETMRFWGFDGSTEISSDFNFRYVTMLKYLDGGGFMNAGNGITGYNFAEQGAVLDVNTGWGLMHELGHNFDTRNRDIAEVTNNILPLHFERIKSIPSRVTQQNLWNGTIYPKVTLDDYSNNIYYPESDYSQLTHIAPFWQLELYYEGFWGEFEKAFRESNYIKGNINDIHNQWAKVASDVLQLDLYEHFSRHGMKIRDDIKTYTSKYSKPDKKLWYVNDRVYSTGGDEFTKDAKLKIRDKKVTENETTLEFSMDNNNINNVLGYEIFRDGEIIGFTSNDIFIDKNVDNSSNHIYEIIAYDLKLNTLNKVTINSTDDESMYKGVNVALGKTVTGTAAEKLNVLSNVTDGDSNTIWVADKGQFPAEVTVNLAKSENIDYIELVFEKDGLPFKFKVETIDSNGKVNLALDMTNNNKELNRVYEIPVNNTIEKIKVTFLGNANVGKYPGAWAAIAEIKAYKPLVNGDVNLDGFLPTPELDYDMELPKLDGDLPTPEVEPEIPGYEANGYVNVALNKPVFGDRAENDRPLSNITDGNTNSLWIASGGKQDAYIVVDLKDAYIIDGIQLTFEKEGLPFRFKVEGIDEKGNIISILDKWNNNDVLDKEYIVPVNGQVRYIKVSFNGKASVGQHQGAWNAIAEIKAFAK